MRSSGHERIQVLLSEMRSAPQRGRELGWPSTQMSVLPVRFRGSPRDGCRVRAFPANHNASPVAASTSATAQSTRCAPYCRHDPLCFGHLIAGVLLADHSAGHRWSTIPRPDRAPGVYLRCRLRAYRTFEDPQRARPVRPRPGPRRHYHRLSVHWTQCGGAGLHVVWKTLRGANDGEEQLPVFSSNANLPTELAAISTTFTSNATSEFSNSVSKHSSPASAAAPVESDAESPTSSSPAAAPSSSRLSTSAD